jgi:hypothetical protein
MSERPIGKVVWIFASLGPPFGYLVLVLLYAVVLLNAWLEPRSYVVKPDIVVIVGFLLFGVAYSYVLGGAAALTAGIVAAFLMTRTGRTPFWIGPVSGLVSLLTSFVLIVLFMPFMIRPESTPAAIGGSALHVIAATLCWIVVRRSLARQQVATPAADRHA